MTSVSTKDQSRYLIAFRGDRKECKRHNVKPWPWNWTLLFWDGSTFSIFYPKMIRSNMKLKTYSKKDALGIIEKCKREKPEGWAEYEFKLIEVDFA